MPAGVARAIVRAPTHVLHRFQIALADVDRSVYTDLDVHVARHPSEDVPFLLTRVLAFALEHAEGLEFGKGLSDADEPAVWRRTGDGRVLTWIDVGSPAPGRLHRAAKLGALVHDLFPGLTAEALAVVNRALPAAPVDSRQPVKGEASESRLSPSWLTRLGDRAAVANNQTA